MNGWLALRVLHSLVDDCVCCLVLLSCTSHGLDYPCDRDHAASRGSHAHAHCHMDAYANSRHRGLSLGITVRAPHLPLPTPLCSHFPTALDIFSIQEHALLQSLGLFSTWKEGEGESEWTLSCADVG